MIHFFPPAPTGKTLSLAYEGRTLTLLNQRCREWTHPYHYQDRIGATLCSSGCGIFSLVHAALWLHPERAMPDPHVLADFSRAQGGRADDGTDRPALLAALMQSGDAAQLGFRYDGDGLRNDLDTLYALLAEKRGVSLLNIRVGHIVTAVDAKEVDGERLILIVDPNSESDHARFAQDIRVCIPGSEVTAWNVNAHGARNAVIIRHAMFWLPLSYAIDFNLLHRLG